MTQVEAEEIALSTAPRLARILMPSVFADTFAIRVLILILEFAAVWAISIGCVALVYHEGAVTGRLAIEFAVLMFLTITIGVPYNEFLHAWFSHQTRTRASTLQVIALTVVLGLLLGTLGFVRDMLAFQWVILAVALIGAAACVVSLVRR